MHEAFLVARWAHYGASLALFGMALFALCGLPGPAERISPATPAEAAFRRWLRRRSAQAAMLTVVSGLAWLALLAAELNDRAGAALDLAAISVVVRQTQFGAVWIGHLTAALLAGLVAIGPRPDAGAARGRRALTAAFAGAVLVTQAATGHAAMAEGWAGAGRLAVDSAHLLAAAAWLGGLGPLGYLLMRALRPGGADWAPLAGRALRRFSLTGLIAVAALVASGVINAALLVGGVTALTSTVYGRVLLIKLALFAAMAALAAVNRRLLAPRLTRVASDGAGAAAALRRAILAEQCLGLLILAAVSLLGTLPPAIYGD